MSTLLFLQYNNYFNRIVKKETTEADYIAAVGNKYQYFNNINFNPNDSVVAEQVVNWTNSWTPDYLVVINGTELNRWFIIESERLRGGQYKVSLRRDVIADYDAELLDAYAFIEKGTVASSNPLIFNSEGTKFNQIKKSEYLLKDFSKAAWIVGYTASNYEGGEITGKYYREPHFEVNGLSGWEYYQYTTTPWKTFKSLSLVANIGLTTVTSLGSIKYGKETVADNGNYVVNTSSTLAPTESLKKEDVSARQTRLQTLTSSEVSAVADGLLTQKLRYGNQVASKLEIKTNSLASLNNKYIKDTITGNVYKITVSTSDVESATTKYTADYPGYIYLGSRLVNSSTGLTGSVNGESVDINYEYTPSLIQLELAGDIEVTMTATWPASYPHLNDAPYGMFCIPYNKDGFKFKLTGTGATKSFDNNIALSIAQAISNSLQSGEFLYDLQLLPYCPVNGLESKMVNDTLNFYGIPDTNKMEFKNESNETIGFALFCTDSSFNLSIQHEIGVINPKLEKECDMYRVVSPNFSSFNEFVPAMNGGVDFFHVNCTYKPYTPFINVHINYKEDSLYGRDYDDSRGLICSGDYSLPVITEAWTKYQIENKNYQNIFDREIQHQEFNNKQEDIVGNISAITGTLTTAAAGAAFGPAGAAVGGVASLAGGIADIVMREERQTENLQYAKDKYQLSLGNIQALPNGLAKTSAFNINNKLWPFVEYYTCTDTEKNMLLEKIKFEGMTINAVGQVKDYIGNENYIKGRLIRIDVKDSNKLIRAIAEELYKGVYY